MIKTIQQYIIMSKKARGFEFSRKKYELLRLVQTSRIYRYNEINN